MIRFSGRRFFTKTTLLFLYSILIPLSSITGANQDSSLRETFRILERVPGPQEQYKWEKVNTFGGVVDIKHTIKIEFDKSKIGDRKIKINAWIREKITKTKKSIEVPNYRNNKTRTRFDIKDVFLGQREEFDEHDGDTLCIIIRDVRNYEIIEEAAAKIYLKDLGWHLGKIYPGTTGMIFGYTTKVEEEKEETLFATALAIVWQPVTLRLRERRWKLLEALISSSSVHITSLNFSDKHSTEIGYGVGLTFLKGLLHLQWGYNPSAKKDYWAVGSDLFSLKEILFSKKE